MKNKSKLKELTDEEKTKKIFDKYCDAINNGELMWDILDSKEFNKDDELNDLLKYLINIYQKFYNFKSNDYRNIYLFGDELIQFQKIIFNLFKDIQKFDNIMIDFNNKKNKKTNNVFLDKCIRKGIIITYKTYILAYKLSNIILNLNFFKNLFKKEKKYLLAITIKCCQAFINTSEITLDWLKIWNPLIYDVPIEGEKVLERYVFFADFNQNKPEENLIGVQEKMIISYLKKGNIFFEKIDKSLLLRALYFEGSLEDIDANNDDSGIEILNNFDDTEFAEIIYDEFEKEND